MSKKHLRVLVLAAIALLLLVGVLWRFLSGGSEGGDTPAARIERLRQSGDVEALAEEAGNQEADVARLAVQALGRVGRPAAPRIERAMSDPRSKVREAAAIALGRAAGEEKADRLAAVARTDDSADVRAAAVAALGRVCACDQMKTLLAAMDDPDITVRRKAYAAVTRILDRRYEYNVQDPPEKRRAVIAIIREAWPEMKAETVKYHAARRKKRED